MKVIAISGWKRSGKDTAANYLVNSGYIRAAFADVLKDMVAAEYSIPRSHCDDPEFKEAPILTLPVIPKDTFTLMIAKMMFREFRTSTGHPPMDYHIDVSGAFLGVLGRDAQQLYWTPRALCILKGSVNRTVDSAYWVGRTIDSIKNATTHSMNDPAGPACFVISDLRYQSEVQQLREAFGANLVTVRVNRFDDCQSQDASERDLDNAKFDVVIENKGSLDELYQKLEALK